MPNHDDSLSKSIKYGFFIVLGLFILLVALGSFFTVPAGARGVVYNSFTGTEAKSYGEGMHFKTPIFEKKEIFSVRNQKYEADASSASKDLQDVQTKVAVNYELDAGQVWKLYQQIGEGYRDVVISPTVQETVKAVTAKYTAEELITHRPEVKTQIEIQLRDRLEKNFIYVREVSITNFQFSEEFSKAIEATAKAKQDAIKEENNLKIIELQAQQKIAAAQGEAEAIRIINIELQKSPEYTKLQMIAKWNGALPTTVMDSNGNVFASLDIGGGK